MVDNIDDVQKQFAQKAKGRLQFKHGDRVVYEWEQNLEDVNMYIELPPVFRPKIREQMKKQLEPGQTLPELEVKIEITHVTVGIKGNPPFMSENLGGRIKSDESYWMIEDEELNILLCKMKKGETWTCACQGHEAMDPLTQQEVQKNILLERFQEENPGFDFS